MGEVCLKCRRVIHEGGLPGADIATAESAAAAWVAEHGSPCYGTDSFGCKDRQLANLQAIVDRLPVFADTREPFIPANIVEVWTVMRGIVYEVTRPLCGLGYRWCNGPYYSTLEAADTAAADDKANLLDDRCVPDGEGP